jgi:UDP-glucuronate 4-epimerase
MSTLIVTGSAGFIGTRTTQMLLAQGHRVIGIDNLNDAYDVRLKEWRLAQIQDHPDFSFHQEDITDSAALDALLQEEIATNGRPDAIINLAARAGVHASVQNPWVYYETNTVGTLNLMEICRRYEIPKFVLASTSSLYGSHNRQPYCEEADTNQPLSPYAASKKAAETLCYTYHYLHNIDVTILRYFTVYGPAGRPDMSLFRFVQWISEGRPVTIFGDGEQSRDFTYVDDIARGTIAALKFVNYEIINLASNEPIVLIDAVHMIEDLVGRKAQLDFQPRYRADVTATWANISKAKKILDWVPQNSFREGLDQLAHWYQANRSWAGHIQTI